MAVYGSLEFVDLKYKPKKTDLVVEYHAHPAKGISLAQLCEYIAGESSIGTWTTISTMNPTIARKLKPHVFYINNKTKEVRVAYPQDLYEPGNMPGILSSIAGNIYGMKAIEKLKFQDVTFPKKIMDAFPGPQFGIKGIRKMTGIYGRPLVGTIVKPKVGLTHLQHAKVAYESWAGGLDIVKDDENLTSMSFNKFENRMRNTFKMRDKAEKETGEKKIYLANITAETDEMKRRADLVKELGGEFIMVDILTAGWASLQTIRKYAQKKNLAIHAHRAMHGALTRDKHHGLSMLTLAKVSRLIGVDTLHIGTAGVGKMHGKETEELAVEHEIEDESISAKPKLNVLQQNWYGKKPVLAVASGGLSPLSMPRLIKIMGIDIIAQAGGGVHGNPGGTKAGAKAMRAAAEAAVKGVPLKEAAKKCKELQWAIDKWSGVKV